MSAGEEAGKTPDEGGQSSSAASTSFLAAQAHEAKKHEIRCVPMKLDAFVLNTAVFSEKYDIAPLNLPNHSAFWPGPFSSHDAVPPVDVHAAFPWQGNTRIADVSIPPNPDEKSEEYASRILRRDRLGVYLHWCLPRRFREGVASDSNSKQSGDPRIPSQDGDIEHAAVPNRWIIFRMMTEAKIGDVNIDEPPELTAFILESNRIRRISTLLNEQTGTSLDIETEGAPFIDSSGKLTVEEQADVILGMKSDFEYEWEEPREDESTHVGPLTLLGSANPLFADFQHHNSNVFSIHDDLSWTDKDEKTQRPTTANVSYAVFGYFAHAGLNDRMVCHGSLFRVAWGATTRPTIVAEDTAERLRANQPIALGCNSLDALGAYLRSVRVGEDSNKFDWSGLLQGMAGVISSSGKSGAAAADAPRNTAAGFKPVDGGRCWRLRNIEDQKSQQGQSPEQAPPIKPEDMLAMFKSNRQQTFLDALDRQERYVYHSLFCEWWKSRSRCPGGAWETPEIQAVAKVRVERGLNMLRDIKTLRSEIKFDKEKAAASGMVESSKPQFFSRLAPSIIVGGMDSAWPKEFMSEQRALERNMSDLPLNSKVGSDLVKGWLKEIGLEKEADHSTIDIGTIFGNISKTAITKPKGTDTEKPGDYSYLDTLPGFFKTLNGLDALQHNSPGWVRDAVEHLLQEWAFCMTGRPFTDVTNPPLYIGSDMDWSNKQPWRPLFVEWELEFYNIPRRFWSLERAPDGTVSYQIMHDVNISSYDGWERHMRVIKGRSLLRPNAAWSLTTLLTQLLSLVNQEAVESRKGMGDKMAGKTDWKDKRSVLIHELRSAFNDLNLVEGSLVNLGDHLLTLRQGIHIIPYEGDTSFSDLDQELLPALLGRGGGFDVTPYGETTFSDLSAGRDFKPVTHGQARFTRFNIVDKFGQVVSPIAKEKGARLNPCISPSLACRVNEVEGGQYANSIELEEGGNSQFFQIGHSINQDSRLNIYFAINSTDHDEHSLSARWFEGDNASSQSSVLTAHSWRPATEYEDPVWGWLIVDYRDRGIQVYNPKGEIMGEALLPSTINSKVYWQVYYAEGDMSESRPDHLQLQQLLSRLSDAKFLFGLWSMLSEACHNISHAPSAYDSQLLNLAGRPMALVNIGIALELATPPMETQSYSDLLKPREAELEEYNFEVFMGEKTNLHDGLVGYFRQPPPVVDKHGNIPDTTQRRPDLDCIYTEFGYPERKTIDSDVQSKLNTFASPGNSPVYVSPFFVDPTEDTENDPAGPLRYYRSMVNNSKTTILGAIVDPFHPVHFASGILPPSMLSLPPWVVTTAMKKMRLLFRGGPLMISGDLEEEDDASRPFHKTTHEASIPPITNDGNWSWLQPIMDEQAHEYLDGLGEKPDDHQVEPVSELPYFVPYNLAPVTVSADYPLRSGPHTCLEGFYKFGLKETEKHDANFLLGKPSKEETAEMAPQDQQPSSSTSRVFKIRRKLRGV